MNVFHRYALESLKKNRARTIVTVIGIMLSLSLFTAVLEGAYSGVMFLRNNETEKEGKYHGAFGMITDETADRIAHDKEIDEYELAGYAGAGIDQSGRVYSVESVNSKSQMHKYILYEGRMPENSREIAVSGSYAYSEDAVNIGDTLTLMMYSGTELSITDLYDLSEDQITKKFIQKEYTVTGIIFAYDTPEDFTDVNACTAGENTGYYNCYYTLKKPSSYYDFTDRQEYSVYTKDHSDLLELYFTVRNESVSDMIYGYAVILILIILLGSVLLIYNSFSISVSERTRQFGILKSVGATKKQIRSGVIYEAFVLSLIAVPAGLALGCGILGAALWKFSDDFTLIYGWEDCTVKIKLVLNAGILAIAAVISILTVLISAWIPAAGAVRVTPLEAIKQSNDHRVGKQKKSSFYGRIFGFEGMMASKNFRRNRRRNHSVVISLALSVILFITAKSFSIYLEESIADTVSWSRYTPDVEIGLFGSENSDFTGLLNRFRAHRKVERAYMTDESYICVNISRDMLSDDFISISENDEDKITMSLIFTDDDFFREICIENGIEPEKYFDRNFPRAVMYNYDRKYSDEMKRRVSVRMMDHETEITLSDEREDGCVEHHVSDYIKTDLSIKRNAYLLYPYSMKSAVPGNEYDSQELLFRNYYINTFDHSFFTEDDLDELFSIIMEDEGKKYDVCGYGERNHSEEITSERAIVKVTDHFSTGFILIISLIATANIINTVSTNIRLRRREFAMLRSVGLSSRSFDKMMNIECLIYGLRSIVWSIPVSVLTTFVIFRVARTGIYTSYHYSVSTAAFAVVCVFAVVFVSMIFAAGKIRNENTVDALRNENI